MTSKRVIAATACGLMLLLCQPGLAEEISGQIASEVTTGTTSGSGARVSKDSDWTIFTVPPGHVINKEETGVAEISARGSEHSYQVEYDNYVEIIPGSNLKWPTTIKAKTHARSSKGHFGGSGAMKIIVNFKYVKFR